MKYAGTINGIEFKAEVIQCVKAEEGTHSMSGWNWTLEYPAIGFKGEWDGLLSEFGADENLKQFLSESGAVYQEVAA